MTNLPHPKTEPASRNVPVLLYPALLVAGIAMIILSMLGIAAITGLLPSAQSKSVAVTGESRRERLAALQDGGDEPRAADRAVTAASCNFCGVVESVRVLQSAGEGSGLGAMAGGVVGGILGNQVGGSRRTAMIVLGAGAGAYAGHELEKKMNRKVRYEVRVRMDDGSLRTFTTTRAGFDVGQRVQVRGRRLVPAG
jgi:outer membrane lipoprotein SlyB